MVGMVQVMMGSTGLSPVSGVSVVGGAANAAGATAASSTARYTLTSGGLEQYKEGAASYFTLGTWLLSGVASDYEARVTVTSGTLSSGTSGSWLNLGTTREWTKVGVSGAGPAMVSFTIEVGLAGTGTALDSASVSLSSDFA